MRRFLVLVILVLAAAALATSFAFASGQSTVSDGALTSSAASSLMPASEGTPVPLEAAASPTGTATPFIANVQVSSITDSSAQVSWITATNATGVVTVSFTGSNPFSFTDVHPDGSTRNVTHLVRLYGLGGNSGYTFQVSSTDGNGVTYTDNNAQNGGNGYLFKTGATIATPSPTATANFTVLNQSNAAVANALMFFTTKDSTGASETWAGMTNASGVFSLPLPLRSAPPTPSTTPTPLPANATATPTQVTVGNSYIAGDNGTLMASAQQPTLGSASQTIQLNGAGAPTSSTTITINPDDYQVPTNTATAVATTVSGNAVQVTIPTVPAGTTAIAQLVITTPSVPTPTAPTLYNAAASIQIVAYDSNGNQIHQLSAPLTVRVTFSAGSFNPYLALIYTIDPVSGQAVALPTTVTLNGDGTYTATAVVTHLSPFTLYAPQSNTIVPQLRLPVLRTNPATTYGW